jgi:hypothetical protein
VPKYVKQFWTWVVSLAVVGGMYFGAAAIHATWAFWALIGVAAVLTGGSALTRWVRHVLTQSHAFPVLSGRVEALQAENDSLREQLAGERRRADNELERGLAEGRSQAFGVVLATAAEVPVLTEITTLNGQLLLAATVSGSPPRQGARYFVRASLTGDVKGAVQVLRFDSGKKMVFLECVDTRNVAFWNALEERANLDSAVPKGIALAPYSFAVDQAQDIPSDVPSIVEADQ